MSVFTFALTPSKGKASARPFARVDKERCREEEFRIALDDYIAEYQRHHAARMGDAGCGAGQTRFPAFTGWFRRRNAVFT
ncbi:MAG TPA: hypothetical protein VJY34_22380 [Roseiarcus sp.]|nr:hypothetical protein [Roseiarcus sp.]